MALASASFHDHAPSSDTGVTDLSLLAEDRDLAQALEPAVRQDAVDECIAPVVRLRRGRWHGGQIDLIGDGIGLLALEGLLLRRVGVDGRYGAELLGSGDLERSRNMAIVHQARVDVRLRMLLWHLADRWGRVTPTGIALPLALNHTVLAELVAPHRPTVTSALSELAARGLVARTDGGWLLEGEPRWSCWSSATRPRRSTEPELGGGHGRCPEASLRPVCRARAGSGSAIGTSGGCGTSTADCAFGDGGDYGCHQDEPTPCGSPVVECLLSDCPK